MIQIFMLSKEEVTKAEVVDEGEVEVVSKAEVEDVVVMAVEVEGDFVDAAEATIRIELHDKHRFRKIQDSNQIKSKSSFHKM